MENFILWVMLCVSGEGGAAHIPARHLTWRPVGARMGRGWQAADAILGLDVCAV